jgi:ribonucleoside-diphosphate reductase alpha chain
MGATHTEKSTSATGALNAVSADGGLTGGAAMGAPSLAAIDLAGPACMLRPGDDGFEECEACQ